MLIGITGGTGFIGRRLVDHHLSGGDTVRVLSRKPAGSIGLSKAVQHVCGDITRDSPSLQDFTDQLDVLYHCAAEIFDEDRMPLTHVQGTQNLCTAAAGRIGHWVQLSSVGAYGSPMKGIITEDSPEQPLNTYEVTKTESDTLVKTHAATGGYSYSILRPSKVMGPGMRDSSLLQMFRFIHRGWFFFIGAPGASANYIPVQNVINALVLLGHHPGARGNSYLICDHRTIEAFTGTIAHLLSKPSPKLRLPESLTRGLAQVGGLIPGFPLTQSRINGLTTTARFSTGRIERELGYTHQVSIEDALEEMVQVWKASHP